MFEVNTFNPHQTGALFCWLVVHRGPLSCVFDPLRAARTSCMRRRRLTGDLLLSVLIHPNTDDSLKDHTEHATWMGQPWPLNTRLVDRAYVRARMLAQQQAETQAVQAQ